MYKNETTELVESILKYSESEYFSSSCGEDLYLCPFCSECMTEKEYVEQRTDTNAMNFIRHNEDCPYILAKKLKEKYEK